MRATLTTIFILFCTGLSAQIYFTRTGHVHVLSVNKFKNIEADNYQIISTLDATTGEIKFEGLLRSFEFRFGALDRAVNSRNLNVNQYPKIKFEGRVNNISDIKFKKPGIYKVEVKGVLFIWDEKRVTSAQGTVIVDANQVVKANSSFVMTIEKQSVNKLNNLMKQKLPEIVNINTDNLGIDRDIKIDLELTYKLRNW